MRVNPDMSGDMLRALAHSQEVESKALQEISSGRRISGPSDDPAAMAALVQNHSQQIWNDQFSQSLAGIKSQLQMADSTLASVVTGLQRAVTLGVEGATGTLSQTDRDAVAAEVLGIRDSVLSLANSSFNGAFLFAGTQNAKAPFQVDSTVTAGVSYLGNSTSSHVEVGENRTMQINAPGDQIFLNPQGSVFESLNTLMSALKSGDGDAISSATSNVRAAFDQVSAQRVFYGNAVSQVEDNDTILSKDKLDLSDEKNRIAGADLAASVSSLINAQTARNALLAAAGQISRTSLFDYLK